MNPVQIGAFVGAFTFSLLIAAIWLIIAKIIPPLRRRPKSTYIPAMVLSVFPQLVVAGGPGLNNFLAGVACVSLLVWQMFRAQNKLISESSSETSEEEQP